MKINKINKSNILEAIKGHKKSKTKLSEELVFKAELKGVENHPYADALDNFENTKNLVATRMKDKNKEAEDFIKDTADEKSKDRIKVAKSNSLKQMKLTEKFLNETCNSDNVTKSSNIYEVKVADRIILRKLVEHAKQYNLKYNIEKSLEENFRYKFILEGKELKRKPLNEDTNTRRINTGLNHRLDYEVLSSVMGQMSDGIWENSSRVQPYWSFADILWENNEVIIAISSPSRYDNPYGNMSDEQVKRYFATKVKQVVMEEIKDGANITWERNSKSSLDYMDNSVTVGDAYRVYDALLNRKSRSDSPENISVIKVHEVKPGDSIDGKIIKSVEPITTGHYAPREGQEPNWFKIEFEDGSKYDRIYKNTNVRKLSECSENITEENLTESSQEDKEAISRYEVDLPELMHTLEDAYLEGKVAAEDYAKALRAAYNILEDVKIDTKVED